MSRQSVMVSDLGCACRRKEAENETLKEDLGLARER